MSFYNNKKVLITGGSGMIGRPLIKMLTERGAKVRVTSLDEPIKNLGEIDFQKADLTHLENCVSACKDMDLVFHLAGIKGSAKIVSEKPATFFFGNLSINTNMMEAARRCGAERYLFTSTVGVYSPAEVFYEDDVWKTFPSEKDKFAGWAKRMGELQAEAYSLQYKWDKITIVRPANVYGPYDSFGAANAMVVPSLIKRAVDGENPFVVWGDGSGTRDFVYSKDVARGMTMALEKCPGPNKPINLGSGTGYSIKNLVNIIIGNLEKKPEVVWDTNKPRGDRKRILDISRAKDLLGWEPQMTLEEGVRKTMDWYKINKEAVSDRYSAFNEK